MTPLKRETFHDNEDGPYGCWVCGDELEDGDEIVMMPTTTGEVPACAGCAANTGFAVEGRSALGIDRPDADATLTRRRAAIEERLPPDATPSPVRGFVPGEWVYELTHPDGRVETLTEERYHALLPPPRRFMEDQ